MGVFARQLHPSKGEPCGFPVPVLFLQEKCVGADGGGVVFMSQVMITISSWVQVHGWYFFQSTNNADTCAPTTRFAGHWGEGGGGA